MPRRFTRAVRAAEILGAVAAVVVLAILFVPRLSSGGNGQRRGSGRGDGGGRLACVVAGTVGYVRVPACPAVVALKYPSPDRCLSLQLAAIFFTQAAPGSSSRRPDPGSRRAEYPRSPGLARSGHQSNR